MADPVTIFQGAIAALKSAADLAQGMSKITTTAEVQAKAVELQQIILSAQSGALEAQGAQFALLQRIRSLEEKLTQVKAWETEKQKYQLYKFESGTFAYVLKEDAGAAEPSHYICASCYENQRKSILQSGRNGPARTLDCHCCTSQIVLSGRPDSPTIPVAASRKLNRLRGT